MRRIFPDHAYEDGRIDGCFWADSVPGERLVRPTLKSEMRADVAIIGAGFTGLSAAWIYSDGNEPVHDLAINALAVDLMA